MFLSLSFCQKTGPQKHQKLLKMLAESTRRVDSSFDSWREVISMPKSCDGGAWENRAEQLFNGSCAWPACSGNSMFGLCFMLEGI
jgi:hypothetical protein